MAEKVVASRRQSCAGIASDPFCLIIGVKCQKGLTPHLLARKWKIDFGTWISIHISVAKYDSVLELEITTLGTKKGLNVVKEGSGNEILWDREWKLQH